MPDKQKMKDMDDMKSIDNNHDYMLETGLDELHTTTREWLSQLQLMKDESIFFEKLLEKNLQNAEIKKKMDKFEQFQNKLIYYKNEVIDRLHNEVRDHDKYLGGLLENRKGASDEAYRHSHKKLENDLGDINREFRMMKQALFSFIEKLRA